jgi:hypothetical protein
MSKYFQICKTFLEVNGKLFEVLRETSEDREPEELKQMLGADIVFRKEGRYYFSKLIPEAQIVEGEEAESVRVEEKKPTEEDIENLIFQVLSKNGTEDWHRETAKEIIQTLKRLHEK